MNNLAFKTRKKLSNILSKFEEKPVFHEHFSNDDAKKSRRLTEIAKEFEEVEFRGNEFALKSKDREIYLRKEGSDISVCWQILIQNEYKTVFDSAKLNRLEVNTIIDAGSNIGLTTLQFLKYFPEARIIAIEPDLENFKQFSKNTKKFSENVVMLQKAVWSENTRVFLHSDFRDHQDWSKRVLKTENSMEIEAVSVNSIMEEYQIETIDILKMDIEGGESEIFKSDCDLSFLDKTKMIAIEIHDEFECRERINEIFLEKKFVLYNSGELTVAINTNSL